jgi:hypothetical protein
VLSLTKYFSYETKAYKQAPEFRPFPGKFFCRGISAALLWISAGRSIFHGFGCGGKNFKARARHAEQGCLFSKESFLPSFQKCSLGTNFTFC